MAPAPGGGLSPGAGGAFLPRGNPPADTSHAQWRVASQVVDPSANTASGRSVAAAGRACAAVAAASSAASRPASNGAMRGTEGPSSGFLTSRCAGGINGCNGRGA